MTYLDAIRESYDTVAEDYVRIAGGASKIDAACRAMIGAFAELARGNGSVADVGCGPGWLTAHLAELGEGSMTALEAGDDERRSPTTAYEGNPVSYGWFLLPEERIATMVEQAGMTITARLLQPGYACFLAIKE